MLVPALIFLIFLTLLIAPFALYPAVLLVLPRSRPANAIPPEGAAPRRCALLFAARDEAAALPGTIERLRRIKQTWPELEIHTWNDASTDATGRMLDAVPDLLGVTHSHRPVGKGRALTALAAGTKAEILILMDANARPDPAGIARFPDHFRDPRIGAVAARTAHPPGSGAPVARAYWRLEEWIKRAESATGSTIGCDGALWAIRRGLFPRLDPAVCDDFRASIEPLLQGYRVISAPDITVEECVQPGDAGWQRMRRIGRGAWHADREIAPRLARLSIADRLKYLLHKRLRWFTGLWLAGMAGSALWLVHLSGAHLYAGLLICLAAMCLALGLAPLVHLRGAVTAALAVTAGVLSAMTGGKEPVWQPQREPVQ